MIGKGRAGVPGARKGQMRGGKRVVYVTPYYNSAKEEAEKLARKGIRAEIKKELDDTGKHVYVVYAYEGWF